MSSASCIPVNRRRKAVHRECVWELLGRFAGRFGTGVVETNNRGTYRTTVSPKDPQEEPRVALFKCRSFEPVLAQSSRERAFALAKSVL